MKLATANLHSTLSKVFLHVIKSYFSVLSFKYKQEMLKDTSRLLSILPDVRTRRNRERSVADGKSILDGKSTSDKLHTSAIHHVPMSVSNRNISILEGLDLQESKTPEPEPWSEERPEQPMFSIYQTLSESEPGMLLSPGLSFPTNFITGEQLQRYLCHNDSDRREPWESNGASPHPEREEADETMPITFDQHLNVKTGGGRLPGRKGSGLESKTEKTTPHKPGHKGQDTKELGKGKKTQVKASTPILNKLKKK